MNKSVGVACFSEMKGMWQNVPSFQSSEDNWQDFKVEMRASDKQCN